MSNATDLLNAAKKQKTNQQNGVKTARAPKSPIREGFSASSIDDLAAQYFGDDSTELTEGVDYTLYPNGEKRKVYDAHEEMQELKEGSQYRAKESNMPSAILESIMNNPLNMPDSSFDVEETVINEDIQNKTMDIINKLESRDKKTTNYVNQKPQMQVKQQLTENTGLYQSNTNNGDLASLIESIIDKKLKQYSGAILNESKKIASGNSPSMKFMKLGESFTFMDDANNVYECKMVYKGKGKIKTK